GTVAPGDSPGILHSGAVTWDDSTTFSVELDGTTAGNGPGHYDQLQVTGTVALNGANLVVSTGSFVPTTGVDSFSIIQSTGNISGTFAQGGVIFANGFKFSITIDNSGPIKTVTLNRIKADTTVSVPTVHLDTAPPQNVTFTATVSPEAFAGGSP